MKHSHWICSILLVLALSVGIPGALAQDDGQAHTLTFDGEARTAYVYVPSTYDESAPVPLVIALHPFASSGKAMAAITGLDDYAEQMGFIVAYPDALDLDWNDGQVEAGWDTPLRTTDDSGYIGALIDDLSATYAIAPGQVYLTGLNVGGMMAYRLACEMPERFARVAVVGVPVWDYHLELCPTATEATDPLSMLILLGASSIDYPLYGTTAERRTADGRNMIIQTLNPYQTGLFWAERSGCDKTQANLTDQVAEQIYTDCAEDTTVQVRVLDGVGSVWPRQGDYTLDDYGFDASAAISTFFLGDAATLDFSSHALTTQDMFGNTPRYYALYVPPSYDPAEPMPLVVALHGRPGTAGGLAYLFDMNRVAAEQGFMVLYPSGTPVATGQPGREWNYTRGAPGYDYYEVDDVTYLKVLIDDLARDLNIDQERLYVTGFSNGGFMTQRLACSAGDTFAAFASVGATLFPFFVDFCEGQPPIPILIMHGTEDPSVPWDGLSVGGEQMSLSVPDTILFWALHDECAPDALDYEILPSMEAVPSTVVYHYTFAQCAADALVEFWVIEGGGHNLPGVPDRLEPEIARTVNTDIHAAEVIWDFFQNYTLSPAE